MATGFELGEFDALLRPRGRSILKSDPRGVAMILSLNQAGLSVNEIAVDQRVRHDPRTVAKVLGLAPTLSTSTHGGKRRDVLGPEGRLVLSALIRRFPKTKDGWRAFAMTRLLGKQVRVGVIRTAYKHLNLTSKVPTTLYSEGLTEKVFLEQQAFMSFFNARKRADPAFTDRCCFIDITSFNQASLTGKGRATGPRGAPVIDDAPSDRGGNHDWAGGITRSRGVMGSYVYTGHVDADVIEVWLEHILLPELNEGDWLILDGGGYWSGRHIVESQIWPPCEAAGVSLLWLPTRSPWFNPIEKFNGWLKSRVAEEVEFGRVSRDNVPEAIHSTIDRHATRIPNMCKNWIDFLFG